MSYTKERSKSVVVGFTIVEVSFVGLFRFKQRLSQGTASTHSMIAIESERLTKDERQQ